MAKSIEITYFPNATAKCSNCSSTYKMGMTVENITIEICGNCHPFYTGQETLIDTAGRIEKFQARSAKAGAGVVTGKKQKVKARKFRQTLADLNDLSESEEEAQQPQEKPAKQKKEAAIQEAVPETVEETEESVSEEEVETTQEDAVEASSESNSAAE